MSGDEDAEYALWLKLSNDPSQSEEARRHHRAQMEACVHKKMREAFQFAAKQAGPPRPG